MKGFFIRVLIYNELPQHPHIYPPASSLVADKSGCLSGTSIEPLPEEQVRLIAVMTLADALGYSLRTKPAEERGS